MTDVHDYALEQSLNTTDAQENIETTGKETQTVNNETGTRNEDPETTAHNETPKADADAALQTDRETTEFAEQNEADSKERVTYNSREDVLERVKAIARGQENPQREEVEHLKTVFYRLQNAEQEARLKAFIENGGDPETYVYQPDEVEQSFKAEMTIVKERRAQIFMEQEQERQDNLQKKLEIIEKIKAMATSPDEANKSYQAFKELQQQWKEIKAVPAEKANELWKNYQLYVEQFYDLLKLNHEAREYDFKKNLDLKTKICEAAERLQDEADIISAFHQLQELHQQYREVGPVSKDCREAIWQRFKAASTVINKRHQQHFEKLREFEEENLKKKKELCEAVEKFAETPYKRPAEWDKITQKIKELQAEWKNIGYAPQKMNMKVFERFRAACDNFFEKKAAFFKEYKEAMAENVAKKKAIVEKAKALKDSTEWKSTADKLIALQKEWKTVGVTPHRVGEQLWNEFLEACNHFFEARKQAKSGSRNEEYNNLTQKRGIIEQLKELAENLTDGLQDKIQELTDQYNSIGHVPFKEKDKLYKEYHEVLDKIYKELNISATKRKLDHFKTNVKQWAQKGEDALDNQRSRLMFRYEQLKSEIINYENNLGFLNAASKKGNSLVEEMNRKVQKLKDDCNLLKEKIKAIDQETKE